jgi:uncharacterized damage-inducible protein DinB
VPPLLQPVAHGLMQCREELDAHVSSLSPGELWARLSGVASIGFHVRHAAGSLDRLFTYARGEALSPAQRAALAAEREPDLAPDAARTLLSGFDRAVEAAIGQLRATDEATILDPRGVGRAQLPSTVLGLLFHAAEHTQRHVGQAVTTARALAGGEQGATGESGNERTTSGRAAGTFEVKLSPLGMDDKTEGTLLGRMSIEKQFHGELEASSRGEMLTGGTMVKGSAGYVAIERVSGTLGGRAGTFVLQHSGTMTRGEPRLTITVVPDSGTGELTGLAGTMAITIADGKHTYELDYTSGAPA